MRKWLDWIDCKAQRFFDWICWFDYPWWRSESQLRAMGGDTPPAC